MKAVIPNNPNFGPYDYELSRMAKLGVDVVFSGMTEAETVEHARDAEILFDVDNLLSGDTIRQLEACRLIAFYGIGYDCVDVAAATECGILVTNTPLFGVDEVANHAVALLLACSRKLAAGDRAVRRGNWDWTALLPLNSLAGQTVGVVGFGNIGRSFGRRMLAFGCRVAFYDPFVPKSPFEGPVPLPLDELMSESDFVSIHVPRMPATTGLIGESQLRRMKPTSYLINTARGPIVHEPSLLRALQEGWIAGAGLDVFDVEPLPLDNPLARLENVLLTPHVAGTTVEAFHRMRVTLCNAVESVLQGDWPEHVVNPAVQPRVGLRRPGAS